MREIKFRAWNKEGREMIRVVGIFFPYENSKSQDIIVNGRGGTANIKTEHLMQFTGLKDKNGKEIYEGDIYKDSPFGVIRLVEIGNYFNGKRGACGVYAHTTEYDDFPEHDPEDFKKGEVIGNVYENPELIKN